MFSLKKILTFSFSFVIATLCGCAAVPGKSPHQTTLSSGRQQFKYFATSHTAHQTGKAAQVDDMWLRLRENFEWEIPADNALITEHKNQLLKKNYYFPKLSQQSQDYIHYVVESLDARGMPIELALLPAIESFYNPFAYSRSKAAGLWQFIPSTGKVYGLAQNDEYDGRRDIVASTQAALNLLEYLGNRFHGDWYLALAAYNFGSTNVEKAMLKNVQEGKPTDYWSLSLPEETRHYVPKLLALVELIRSPEQYSLELPPLYNKPSLKVLTMDGPFSLTQAAQLADIPLEQMRRLNAGYARSISPRNGPFQLILPIAKAEKFQQEYAQLKLNTPEPELANDQTAVAIAEKPRNQAHKVQQGETLWGIAHRYQVDVARLASWNNITANSPLQQGQTLNLFTDR